MGYQIARSISINLKKGTITGSFANSNVCSKSFKKGSYGNSGLRGSLGLRSGLLDFLYDIIGGRLIYKGNNYKLKYILREIKNSVDISEFYNGKPIENIIGERGLIDKFIDMYSDKSKDKELYILQYGHRENYVTRILRGTGYTSHFKEYAMEYDFYKAKSIMEQFYDIRMIRIEDKLKKGKIKINGVSV